MVNKRKPCKEKLHRWEIYFGKCIYCGKVEKMVKKITEKDKKCI